MNDHRLELQLVADRMAVCRLGVDESIPEWATEGEFFSITRTCEELSVVCREASVPSAVRAESGWRAIRVAGPIDFSVIGVLASLAVPLSAVGISLFSISTFDTDYLLVKEHDLGRAVEALIAHGHSVHRSNPPR